jgi:hypothetical protein
MFSRTPWRISTWNAETVSAQIVIGLGGGAAQIGLENRSIGARHTLQCAGVTGSIGPGVNLRGVNLGSGATGFRSDDRTQGGTLYKNDVVVRGELTLDHLRDAIILVQGLELVIMDEGQAGYLVLFASTGATLSTFLGGGGLLSEGLAIATCRAMTFLSAAQAGLPSLAAAGYRFTVTGVT